MCGESKKRFSVSIRNGTEGGYFLLWGLSLAFVTGRLICRAGHPNVLERLTHRTDSSTVAQFANGW